jgi:nitrate/nitrite-specific signal transduction histidine kinase
VENHSKANVVNVLVNWTDSFLDISVADNGKGFNPAIVNQDEHFGLGILQERIARLKGELMLNSSADSGTIVSISVPVKLAEKLPYEQ